jgi:hypothetical protein
VPKQIGSAERAQGGRYREVTKLEDIAYDPTHSKLNEIGPPYAAGQYCTLNCPATAASLE